ncbi:MAG TPA: chemotaxis protein CheW [Oculatellaceae cyanobacterium]
MVEVREAFDGASESDDSVNRSDSAILESRAVKLARKIEHRADEPTELLYFVEFLLANQRYGLALNVLREVHPLRYVTKIPCVPAHIVGVFNLRGQVVTIVDLKHILKMEKLGPRVFNKAIVTEHRGLSIAFMVDEVMGSQSVARSAVYEHSSGGAASEFITGVTESGVILLDAEKLMTAESLWVR